MTVKQILASGIGRSGKVKNVTAYFGEAFTATPAFGTHLLQCDDTHLHKV
jgi:hypothetical protein